jgi:AraC family transcriptional regulator
MAMASEPPGVDAVAGDGASAPTSVSEAGGNRWVSSVRAVRYRPSSRMAPHRHDQASLCLVLSGHYLDRIRGEETEHRSGHLLFCPPFEAHAQVFSKLGALKLIMRPTGEALDHLAERTPLDRAPFVRSPRLAGIGAQLAAELRSNDESSGIIIEGLIGEMLGLLGRYPSGPRRGADTLTRAAYDFVLERAGAGVSVGEVAAAVGGDPLRLSLDFRRAYGLTIGQHARKARLTHAMERLALGSEPLSQVASDAGFYDQAHFTRAFKAAYGMAPGRFRSTLQ